MAHDELGRFFEVSEKAFDVKVNYARSIKDIADRFGLSREEVVELITLSPEEASAYLDYSESTNFVFPDV